MSERWIFGWVIGSGLVLAISVMLWTRSQNVLPSGWMQVRELYEQTHFASADVLLARFRRDWAAGDEEREAIIAKERQRMRLFATRLEAGRQRLIAAASDSTSNEQRRGLREQRESEDPMQRRLATILLSKLVDLRIEGKQKYDLEAASRWLAVAREAGSSNPAAAPVAEAKKPAQEKEPEPASVVPEAPKSMIEAALARGHYFEAAELCTQMLLQANPSDAEVVGRRLQEVLAKARSNLGEVVDAARTLATKDSPESFSQARSMLFGALGNLPMSQGLREIRSGASRLASSYARRSKVLGDFVAPRDIVLRRRDQGREYEQAGRFRKANELYQLASSLAADGQPFASTYLAGKAWECSEVADLVELIAKNLAGSSARSVDLSSGRSVAIQSLSAGKLVGADGELVSWSALASSGIAELLAGIELSPRNLLAAGLLGYARNDWSEAEARIAEALDRDPSLADVAAGVIARGRDELLESTGYNLVDGHFVSKRSLHDQRMVEEFSRRLDDRKAKGPDAWDQILEGLLAAGPASIEPVIAALQSRVLEDQDRAQRDRFARSYRQLRLKRVALDGARRAALQLIFSEERYFYPCQEPAVSASRQAEFEAVQEEVDRRVRALRDLWQQENHLRRPSAELRRRMQRIDWMIIQLDTLGESTAHLRRKMTWWRSLPSQGELSLQNFCWDGEERHRRDAYAAIRTKNAASIGDIASIEAEQVKATNDYREMFGLAPLAFDERLYRAGKDHVREMERRGYFSHFSPDPEHHTSFDRAVLAGYPAAVSENIMQRPLAGEGSSAEEAMTLWTRISAQHRNLLDPNHRDFAVSKQGMNWAQVFGRGIDH